jgi:FKBP-type peptidyl-prolyl cis-trans isomerase SlyD
MQIDTNKVVTIDYTLTDQAGNVLDQSQDGDFAYLHGAQNIIPGLESALSGRSVGDELNVSISAEDAYGQRDEAKVQAVPRELFPTETEVQVGMQFHAEGPEGHALMVTVVEVADQQVTVDANHPLAGVGLNFDVKVVDVRDATEEEIEHGHAHHGDVHPHD